MSSEKKAKKCKIKKAVCYVIGSAAVCAGAVIIIPKVSPYISGTISKKMAKISIDRYLHMVDKNHVF